MAENTFRRLEKKILADTSLVPALQERLAEYMDLDKHNSDGEPYTICNIYFDTPNDDVIRESIQKPKFKEKMRLRSYGTPKDDDMVFIELKRKLDGVSTKRRVTLPMKDAKAYLENGIHPEGLSYVNQQILNEIDYYRQRTGVVPASYVSYRRIGYYAKDDPKMRLTFDFDILTRRTDLDIQAGRFGDPLLPDGLTLIEVKFPGAVPLWLCHILDEFHLSFGTFSKAGSSFKHFKLDEIAKTGFLSEDEIQIISEDIKTYGRIL